MGGMPLLRTGRHERITPVFNLLLQPEFPINALILASEALRIANQNSGQALFHTNLISDAGGAVRASNGMWMDVDFALDDMPKGTHYLVFGGNLPTQHVSTKLLAHLRAAARLGAVVGGVDTGAFALAKAGLSVTEGSSIVVLWEAAPTFHELFPEVSIVDQIGLRGNHRIYSAGGVATLDMVLDLIEDCNGHTLADEVANALVHTRRLATLPQRGDALTQPTATNMSVRVVQIMEQNLDFPMA